MNLVEVEDALMKVFIGSSLVFYVCIIFNLPFLGIISGSMSCISLIMMMTLLTIDLIKTLNEGNKNNE